MDVLLNLIVIIISHRYILQIYTILLIIPNKAGGKHLKNFKVKSSNHEFGFSLP